MTTATITRSLSFVGAPLSAWAFGIRIWVAVVDALARFWQELEAPSTTALAVAILAASTRGSFAQNNLSTDCDAGRRHAGPRSEQMSQKPTFVPKGADLYQTAAMRSDSVKLLSGHVSDRGLEGSASARGKCPTPCFAFFASSAASKAGPLLSEASEQPNGGQLIQGVKAMADVTNSDRSPVVKSDTAQFSLGGVALSPTRETVP
jgi:hypothetical protein